MILHYPYLLIGGGIAADAAARGIRTIDTSAMIGLIGDEADPPYNRPPLSKGLWKPTRPTPFARIWRGTAALDVAMHLERRIVQLDPVQKQVSDDYGQIYTYEKLLLATGGSPVRLGPTHDRVIYFRTLEDYRRLRILVENEKRFAVIGGGFIGSEIAAALIGLGRDVSMIFPEPGIGARILPVEISSHLNTMFRERDVRVLHGQLVETVEPDDSGVTLVTSTGETLRVDAVIAGLGIRPNIFLAEIAGLEIHNGISVDMAMRTSKPDIFAAGDVANFYSSALGKFLRPEHEENANLTGMLAGQGMAGEPGRYDALPAVYSTLFDATYDAVGDLDSDLEIIYDWVEPFQKGAVYYFHEGRVRGVLLWNMGKGVDTARQIINEPHKHRETDLKGRISG